MTNKQWFNLHSWAGLFLGGLLLFVCLTGTLATISHEIEYLTDQKYRALTPRNKTDFYQLEIELSKKYPQSYLQSIEIRTERYLSGEALLVTDNLLHFVYFDPNTGKILGNGNWGRLSRFLRDIHRKLSMGDAGKLLVTSFNFLLFIILISSFFVYKRWWRHFFKQPDKIELSKRTSWSSWHKFFGIWSWWFIALISITSFWYFVDQSLETMNVEYYPKAPKVISINTAVQPISLTEVVKHAQSAFESLNITQIRYPRSNNKPIEIRGENGDFLVTDSANRIYLHPSTGEVLHVQYAGELSIFSRVTDMVDLLHFGNFYGVVFKLVWFTFGILFSFMIVSGTYLAWLKIKRKQPSFIKWQGLLGVTSIALCIVAIILTSINMWLPVEKLAPYSPQLTINKNK